jgi:hypothetical protein
MTKKIHRPIYKDAGLYKHMRSIVGFDMILLSMILEEEEEDEDN